MKMIFSSIIIFLIMGQSLVAEEGFFSQRDKQKHILGSGAIGVAIAGVARSNGLTKIESFFLGVGTAIGIGLIKEGIDGYNVNGTRDWDDVKADAIGGIIGAGISAQFEWKF